MFASLFVCWVPRCFPVDKSWLSKLIELLLKLKCVDEVCRKYYAHKHTRINIHILYVSTYINIFITDNLNRKFWWATACHMQLTLVFINIAFIRETLLVKSIFKCMENLHTKFELKFSIKGYYVIIKFELSNWVRNGLYLYLYTSQND